MTLPKRPPLNQPIPNADIPNVPRQYSVKAPYWDAVISGDLIVTEDGALAVEGSTIPPTGDIEVLGEYWSMPLGNGLGLWRGEVRTLEPDLPPYGCRTDVYTRGVTDFTDAWKNCGFSSFPSDIDTSAGTDFSYTWSGCENLKSFPALDFSSGSNFYCSWSYCSSLETFPVTDFSAGTDFFYTWGGCTGLVEFPQLDLSHGVNFEVAWALCNSLTSFPMVNTSSGENFSGTWGGCNSLTSFPPLDVSSGSDFSFAWNGCTSLTSFPLLDVSSGTNFDYAWHICSQLTSFPLLDVSQGTSFAHAWEFCTLLGNFPVLDVSNGITFNAAWSSCANLYSFPALDFSSGMDFTYAWTFCLDLVDFPANVFDTCPSINFYGAWYNCALSQQSVDNILVSLDTAGQEDGTVSLDGGTSAAPSATGWAAVASLQGKGWTVLVNGVQPLITIGTQPSNSSVTAPAPTSFSVSATTNGGGTLGYQWQLSTDSGATFSNVANGGVYSGATSSTLEISDTTGLNGRVYRVVVTSTGGAPSVSSSSATLTVISPLITIGTQPSNSSVTAPAPTSFSVSATTNDGGTLSYQWKLSNDSGVNFSNVSNGGVYSGATTSTLEISDTTGLNGLVFRVVVTSTGGAPSVNSSSATLTVTTSYIYCTPAYPGLPVTYPPYSCNTTVNTSGVTNFTNAWADCPLSEFPCVDTSSGTNFTRAWYGIGRYNYTSPIRSFPLVDTSSGVDFTFAWAWSTLNSFPELNLSSGTNFTGAFSIFSLVNFPGTLDFSSGTNFSGAWSYCSSLTSFPELDVSSGTNFVSAWEGCSSLTSFPELDVSSGTNFNGAWFNCSSLTSFPTLDVSSGTNFSYAWFSCTSLTTFPALNFSSAVNSPNGGMMSAWENCTSLVNFPPNLFNNCLSTKFNDAWKNCALSQQSVDNILVSINAAGTSNGTLGLSGGTSAAPSATGLAAKAALQARGWTVLTN